MHRLVLARRSSRQRATAGRVGGRLVRLFGALVVAAGSVACGANPAAPTVDPGVLPPLSEMVADKTMGSASAPNTVIVYSSFTCPHCADAHLETLPQLKSKYIDAGKVRFIFRDWERNSLDIRAGMLARCAGDARYFDAVDTLFRNQASWASATDPNAALANLMRQFGLSQAVIDACVASASLSGAIVNMHNDGATRYGVSGTPTYVVNEQVIVGDVPLTTIEAKLNLQ